MPSSIEPGYRCSECGFELWLPIAQVGTSHLGLYDDARFPGRCLLVLDEHHEDLAELDPERSQLFLADAQRAARAIVAAVRPTRMNFAVLGNTASHLHFHLVPRFSDREPNPTRSPWNDGRPVTPLSASERTKLIARIAAALDRT